MRNLYRWLVLGVLSVVVLWCGQPAVLAQEAEEKVIRQAIERSIELLEIGSAGSADQRQCFTCHSQAMPVLAFAESLSRGVRVDEANLGRQVLHTYEHLRRGRKRYDSGKGQGGGVDTAGYALWTLEEGQWEPDEVTGAVVNWLIGQQRPAGHWKHSSNRPPSEASSFTTTYLALRALGNFATDEQTSEVDEAFDAARRWLLVNEPADTEEYVFRLLSLAYVDADSGTIQEAEAQLRELQRADGGWSQLPDMDSDAYATGTALYALHHAGGMASSDAPWRRGIQFLLDTQLDDGTWHVASRSSPFQPYYETGFPHRADQFISSSATAWATLALVRSLPPASRAPVTPAKDAVAQDDASGGD